MDDMTKMHLSEKNLTAVSLALILVIGSISVLPYMASGESNSDGYIDGKVYDADYPDLDVSDATVTILNTSRNEVVERLTTNWLGEYSANLPPGKYEITINDGGYKSKSFTINLRSGENKIVNTGLDPRKGFIRGQVGNFYISRKIPNASITVRNKSTGSVVARAETDDKGYYGIYLGTEGEYEVTAEKKFFKNVTQSVTLGSGEDAVQDFNLIAKFGFITGDVATPDRNPVENATVKLINKSTGELERTTKTDSDGHFRIKAKIGSHSVKVTKEGYSSATYSGTVEEPSEELEFYFTLTPGPGRIKGMISDNEGNPIKNATVVLNYFSGDKRTVQTNSEGIYSSEVPRGEYGIEASKWGYDSNYTEATVEENSTTTANLTLKEQPTGSVAISVYDDETNQIPKANLDFVYLPTGNKVLETTTDTNGDYIQGDIPVGDYKVTATKPGFTTGSVEMTVTEGNLTTDSITIESNSNSITSCQTISSPGRYILLRNLSSTSSNCLEIVSSDVVLNGGGYSIKGGSQSNVGVKAKSAMNVTVKNLVTSGWERGILFEEVKQGNIIRVQTTSNNYGMYFSNSSKNKLNHNSASGNNWAFYSVNDSVNRVVDLSLDSNTTLSFSYKNIGVKPVPSPPESPGLKNIGGYVYTTNTSKDSLVLMNFSYSDSDLGDVKEDDLGIYRYDNGSWEKVDGPTGTDTRNNYVYAKVSEYGIFGLFGKDADLRYKELNISSKEVSVGDKVDVSAKIENKGKIEAEYNLSLMVNDSVRKYEKGKLPPGESKTVKFNVTFDSKGRYKVSVSGFSSEMVTVKNLSVNEAIAGIDGNKSKISFKELQKAIEIWINEETVPGTDKKIRFEDLQKLISIWANDGTVGEGS